MGKIPTGIPGLDEILNGGLEKGWSYLVKGGPGSGKTIFGLQFLMEGAKKGEEVVYISFDETKEEITLQAKNFGWDINTDNFHFIDKVSEMDILTSDMLFLDYESLNDIQGIINSIIKLKELKNADRVFVDGIGILRDAVKDQAIYRRIMASVIHYFSKNNITAMISEELTEKIGKEITSYLTSGEFLLERVRRKDGEILRTINVLKYRAGKSYLGRHYFEITSEGIVVYPIIPPTILQRGREGKIFSTGCRELDLMLGGGIYDGSTVLIAGKSGVGKTNLCLQILMENDRRGNAGILYTLEEPEDVILERFRKLFNYEPSNLEIRHFTSYNMSIGKFYNISLKDFERLNPKIIVVDPVNTLQRMCLSIDELKRVFEISRSCITDTGLILITTYEVSEAADIFQFTGAGISFIADYLILGRFVEMNGKIQKVITVMKNRYGNHEKTLRILDFKEKEGLSIGKPLVEYTGLMGTRIIERA